MTTQPPKNILIRSVNWIGDAVMTTPALLAVRRHWTSAKITLLANPLVGRLLTGHPALDQVITFDRKGEHSGIVGRLRLARKLSASRFDLVLILPNSFDSALVPWLARIPQRWGKASDGRSLLLTRCFNDKHQPANVDEHEVHYYLRLLESFGINAELSAPQLFTTADEDGAAAELLASNGITESDTLLGINAGASFGSAKRWYPERFAEVAQQLARAWQAKIILFGGPDEQELVAKIGAGLNGNCLNMAGKTSVRELMALIKRCNFFISNDSGPMHIAAAFGIPLVAIFGPTDHKGTAPFGCLAEIVRKTADCAPCKLRHCPTDHRCMTAVTADYVVIAADRLWRQVVAGR